MPLEVIFSQNQTSLIITFHFLLLNMAFSQTCERGRSCVTIVIENDAIPRLFVICLVLGIMECTCMLFTFENGVLLMR